MGSRPPLAVSRSSLTPPSPRARARARKYEREVEAASARGGARLARYVRVVSRVARLLVRKASEEAGVANNWFKLFRRYDTDGTGAFDFGEIRAIVRKVGARSRDGRRPAGGEGGTGEKGGRLGSEKLVALAADAR